MILLQTDSETGDEKAKEVAKAIHERINEFVVNCVFLQHKEIPEQAYVDCCVKDVVADRLHKAENLGYVSKSSMKDLYLKEGATLSISAQNDIALVSAGRESSLQFQFSTVLDRAFNVFVAPSKEAFSIAKPTFRGFVSFSAALKDVGPSEIKLRGIKGNDARNDDDDVTLCSAIVSIKVFISYLCLVLSFFYLYIFSITLICLSVRCADAL